MRAHMHAMHAMHSYALCTHACSNGPGMAKPLWPIEAVHRQQPQCRQVCMQARSPGLECVTLARATGEGHLQQRCTGLGLEDGEILKMLLEEGLLLLSCHHLGLDLRQVALEWSLKKGKQPTATVNSNFQYRQTLIGQDNIPIRRQDLEAAAKRNMYSAARAEGELTADEVSEREV